MIMQFICTSEWIVLADWHLEVFLYYKIKNAGVHVFSIIHPNIYYRTSFFLRVERKGLGVWKELQVVNSVGAWNLSVVDFGSAWAAKRASGLVPV